MSNKNIKLRFVWIIPNIFLYVLFVCFGVFVFINKEGLTDINLFGIWVIGLFLLLIVAVIGTYRIWSWIKQGKM